MSRLEKVLGHVMRVNKLIRWRVMVGFDESYDADKDIAFSAVVDWAKMRS